MSIQIIQNRKIKLDPWQLRPTDYQPGFEAPPDAQYFVPLKEWLGTDKTSRTSINSLFLEPDESVLKLRNYLHRIQRIALDFRSHTEGRGFSQATQLRQQLGFKGQMRAIGARRDNLQMMERCGIDCFELISGEDPVAALSSFDDLDTTFRSGLSKPDYKYL